jgi:hypothetical protein
MSRLSTEIDRTYWEKKPYGFHITKWKHPRGIIPNSGTWIFSFNWKNPNKIEDKIENYRPKV